MRRAPAVYHRGLGAAGERVNWQKGRVYLYIEGIADRDSAEQLRGELIEVPDSERPSADEPYWYVDEIEGLRVVGVDGRELGTVRESAANRPRTTSTSSNAARSGICWFPRCETWWLMSTRRRAS